MVTHSSILAWKSYGQKSLAGYSPRGHKESATTEGTQHARTHKRHLIFYFILLAVPLSMWHLKSLIRDPTLALCTGSTAS